MDSQEKIEATVSFVARMVISLMLPLWGLAMLILGVAWVLPWWIICGAVTAGVGLILAVGNPFIWPMVSEAESRPPRS
jgi:hypothetical protein